MQKYAIPLLFAYFVLHIPGYLHMFAFHYMHLAILPTSWKSQYLLMTTVQLMTRRLEQLEAGQGGSLSTG